MLRRDIDGGAQAISDCRVILLPAEFEAEAFQAEDGSIQVRLQRQKEEEDDEVKKKP